jgi:hypothetical protein
MTANSKKIPSTEVEQTDEPLSDAEQKRLSMLMGRIAKNAGSVAEDLFEIHAKRLYRDGYKSFGEFAEAELNMSRAHAYRAVEAVTVRKNLASPMGDTPALALPVPNDRQARELARIKSPDDQLSTWAELTEGGKTPTAEDIKTYRETELAPPLPKRPDPAIPESVGYCESCGDYFGQADVTVEGQCPNCEGPIVGPPEPEPEAEKPRATKTPTTAQYAAQWSSGQKYIQRFGWQAYEAIVHDLGTNYAELLS